jgi:hypothetical protein
LHSSPSQAPCLPRPPHVHVHVLFILLLFSFWQATTISILGSAGVITHFGPYRRHGPKGNEKITLALKDTLICLEYITRIPIYHSLQDAFGAQDVLVDMWETLCGEGMDYRVFELSEGYMHQGGWGARGG